MHPAQEPGQLACARDPRPAHRSFSASTCTRTNRTSRRTVTASFFAGRSGRPTAPTISGPRCCSNCRTGLRRMDSGTTSLLPLQWGLTTLQTLLDSFHPALAPSHLPPRRDLAPLGRKATISPPSCVEAGADVLAATQMSLVGLGKHFKTNRDIRPVRKQKRGLYFAALLGSATGPRRPADDRWIAQQITEA
jgi:hypothetical protein